MRAISANPASAVPAYPESGIADTWDNAVAKAVKAGPSLAGGVIGSVDPQWNYTPSPDTGIRSPALDSWVARQDRTAPNQRLGTDTPRVAIVQMARTYDRSTEGLRSQQRLLEHLATPEGYADLQTLHSIDAVTRNEALQLVGAALRRIVFLSSDPHPPEIGILAYKNPNTGRFQVHPTLAVGTINGVGIPGIEELPTFANGRSQDVISIHTHPVLGATPPDGLPYFNLQSGLSAADYSYHDGNSPRFTRPVFTTASVDTLTGQVTAISDRVRFVTLLTFTALNDVTTLGGTYFPTKELGNAILNDELPPILPDGTHAAATAAMEDGWRTADSHPLAAWLRELDAEAEAELPPLGSLDDGQVEAGPPFSGQAFDAAPIGHPPTPRTACPHPPHPPPPDTSSR